MRRDITIAGVVLAGALAFAGPAMLAQQPAAPGTQKPTEPTAGQPPAGQPPQGEGRGQGRGGRGGGGGPQTAPLNVEDRTGFESIFDGTMKNWDGDPAYWKAEGGSLVGVSTAENPVKENTFLIWRGGEPADFELKLDFKMNSTNSGIQFRSQHVPPGGEGRGAVAGKWVLKGYQADIDFNNQFTGMVYEERGRMFLTQRQTPRQAVYIGPDGSKTVIGHLERNADELKGLVKPGEWNSVHLIARGNTIINIVNGHVMTIIVDDDAKGRAMKGLIGFQIHTGPPMRIEYKNIYLKKL